VTVQEAQVLNASDAAVGPQQGDQIGRISAYRATVFFGQFFKYRSSANFLATFFRKTNYVMSLTKKRVGLHLKLFFTNSSGRPGPRLRPVDMNNETLPRAG
jgi:hypothetical protein